MNFLQGALAQAKGALSWRTYEAAEILAQVLLDQDQWLPGRALLQFLLIVEKNDKNISAMLIDLFRSPHVPLLLKKDPQFGPLPENAPWEAGFTQAFVSIAYGDWLSAERKLSELAHEFPDSSVIWRTLATLRGWLADSSGCIAAWEKYASLDIPWEDAVEAEATAMLLADHPLGDETSLLNVTWTVNDVERLQETLLSDPRLKPINFNAAELVSEDAPPPKAIFMLLDRPATESLEAITAHNLPRSLGQLFLFGRQTDREARLQLIGLSAADLGQVKSMISTLAGEWLAGEEKTDEFDFVSATEDLLQPRWRAPQGLKTVALNKMLGEYQRHAVLNRWPEMKLGVLGGLSPAQAAAEPRLRNKLLGAILVLQHYADLYRCTVDLNELRGKLGLPILAALDHDPGKISPLPLTRLARLILENLSDEELLRAFQRAVGYYHRTGILKFAAEIINRPSFAGRKEQLPAYMSLAHTEEDFDRALAYIEAGRLAADTSEKSHAIWDLEELSLRFARQELPEAVELIRHIETAHLNEPNVPQLLTQILVNVGLLRPDGTLARHPTAEKEEMAEAGAAGGEPGKLWTPDGETSGGGGKLWVPE